MKVSKIYLPVFLSLLIFAGSLFAQNRQKMGRSAEMGQRGLKKERMMNLPGLTDEQKDKMKEVRLSGMKVMQPIRNQIGEKQARLHTLETANTVDMNAINGLIDEIASLRTAQAKIRAGNKQKMRSLLNDEQRLIFDRMKSRQGRNDFGQGQGRKGGRNRRNCIMN